ncbi:hypothetical protein D3C86_989130 [compost metagenome]
MLPAAPGLFSTITGWPKVSDIFWPRILASTSLDPPGGSGTMIRIGLFGNVCARASWGNAAAAAVAQIAANMVRR